MTRYGGDKPGFIKAVMQEQLLNNVKIVHEKIARDAILTNCKFKFLGNKSPVTATNNLAQIDGSGSNMFDITYLDEVARRFAVRSMDSKHNWGDFANPVPGEDFRNNVLVMVPTMVYSDIWESPAKEWLVDLRQYGDQRPINSAQPAFQYRNITVADYGMELSLFNTGRILKQVAVEEPINWGDGAPDPETNPVDGVWLTGQGNTAAKHYIKCGAASFQAGDFEYGEFINIHVKTTAAYGITGGCDPLDGMTITAEVYSSDPATGQIVLRKPITEQFNTPIANGVFAYVTKAQHIHPVYVIGARGMVTWAARTPIEWNAPSDEEADFPSVKRVTWNERGEMNPWDLDQYEIVYTEANFANRGSVSIR